MIPNTHPKIVLIDLNGVPDTARIVIAWNQDGQPLVCGPRGLATPDGRWAVVNASRPARASEIEDALHAAARPNQ